VYDLDGDVEAGVSPKLNYATAEFGRTGGRRLVYFGIALGARARRRSRPGAHLALESRHHWVHRHQ
jgi:hypothetical protein